MRRAGCRRRGLLALAAAWPALGHGAAPNPGAFVVRDDRGTEHRFDAPPQRIVSLLPSLTEAVWVLGGGDRLVGVDRYSDWPAALGGLPRLGGIDDTPVEAVVALRPDVVLASTGARAVDRLDELGLRVLRLRSDTHADVRRALSLVARLLGREEAAVRAWAAIEQAIASAAARVPAQLRGRPVYFEIGGGGWAAGRGSFIGETLAALGLDNIVPASMGPFPKLNPEFVIRAQPAVILGAQREFAAMSDRPGWHALPAIRDDRRCGFPTAQYDVLVRPGPRLGEAAGLLAGCLERLGGR